MPCRSFYRHGRSLVKTFPSDKFVIVGVNLDEPWVIQKLKSNDRILWRNFQGMETTPDFQESFNPKTLGLSIVIDEEGIIRHLLDHTAFETGDIEKAIKSTLSDYD